MLQIDSLQDFCVQDVCVTLDTCEAADSPLQGFMALGQLQLRAHLLFMHKNIC